MEHLPTIAIRVIPHKCQNYDTAGDYEALKSGWMVTLSELPDWRYEALVMMHELVEMLCTRQNGVPWEAIDAFDTGEGKDLSDPGMCPKAPYHQEHLAALLIEKQLACLLGVNWAKYEQTLDALEWRK